MKWKKTAETMSAGQREQIENVHEAEVQLVPQDPRVDIGRFGGADVIIRC